MMVVRLFKETSVDLKSHTGTVEFMDIEIPQFVIDLSDYDELEITNWARMKAFAKGFDCDAQYVLCE